MLPVARLLVVCTSVALLHSPARAQEVFTESFADPFEGWWDRWLAQSSTLNSYYAAGCCAGKGSGADGSGEAALAGIGLLSLRRRRRPRVS